MSLGISKKTKLGDLLHFRIKVISQDGRQFIGELMSFDKHMNMVLSECEELRVTKKSLMQLRKQAKSDTVIDESAINEEKRYLGLVILRGEHIVSFSLESAPAISQKPRIVPTNSSIQKGKGVVKPLKTASSVLSNPIRTSKVVKPIKSGGFKR